MPRYAQHFLINKHAIDRIAASAELDASSHVVEIGPGKGALTLRLLDHCQNLTVIEIDPVWVERLQTNFGHRKNFKIIHQDILKFDFELLPKIDGKWKVVGNLPYNLTSPILRILCEWNNWSDAWVMVQKEVGDRMTAKAGTPHYGALTVGINLTCTVEKIFDLSRNSFEPPPKVDSSVLRMKRRPTPLSDDVDLTQKIIQAAFQQRRKTILNSLSHGLKMEKENTISILKEADIQEDIRPERLPIEKFVKLSNIIKLKNSSADYKST